MAFGCKKSADGSDQVVYKGHVLFHGGIGRLTLEAFPSGVFGGAFEIKHAGFVPMDIAFGGLLEEGVQVQQLFVARPCGEGFDPLGGVVKLFCECHSLRIDI